MLTKKEKKIMDREDYEDRLKDRLCQFQKDYDLSGKELASIMKIPESNLSNILSGAGRKLSVYQLFSICKEFNVTADHFVLDDFPEESHEAHDVCQLTGLSESAVKKLHALMSSRDLATQKTAPVLLDCLNLLIENIDSKKPYTSVLWDISFLTHADQMSLSTETSTGDLKLNNLSFDNEYAKVGYAPGAQKLIEGITEEFFKTRVFDGLRNLGKKKAKRKRTPCPTYTK